QGLIAFPRV
uniref:Periviscerokinin-1 n=2 Tax=Chroicopterinae TaxID=268300 RepID=PVK1_CHRSK|nr:RecName: Full=Periviscerokinin-1 [Chroicoptera sp. Kasungu]P86677.1 RecName: Full=Periviscerokinin-1; Short=Entsp-PVK-1 [Entella sp. Beaufort-W]